MNSVWPIRGTTLTTLVPRHHNFLENVSHFLQKINNTGSTIVMSCTFEVKGEDSSRLTQGFQLGTQTHHIYFKAYPTILACVTIFTHVTLPFWECNQSITVLWITHPLVPSLLLLYKDQGHPKKHTVAILAPPYSVHLSFAYLFSACKWKPLSKPATWTLKCHLKYLCYSKYIKNIQNSLQSFCKLPDISVGETPS